MKQTDPSFIEFLIQALRQGTLRPDPPMRDPNTGAVMPESQPTGTGTVDNAANLIRSRRQMIDQQSGF